MARERLIQLVEAILDVERHSEEQVNEMLDLLQRSVAYPVVSNLVYDNDPMIEEIIDEAINQL
ncbi:MAG: hypothetical protein E6767_03945 [Dysgonomonas sp.]|nr:hypothetical protein [Dysgonomonas sp.]